MLHEQKESHQKKKNKYLINSILAMIKINLDVDKLVLKSKNL
jgi:hypothetical protein